MLDACAHDVFEIAVVESIGFDCPHIFVSQVDARDAFVVGRNRDRGPELSIQWKGMIFSADAEDLVVTGEADFHQDAFARHFFQQLVRTIFVHHVDAVSDALGLGFFDGEANVATEAFVGHEAGRQFARVQGQVNLGVKFV